MTPFWESTPNNSTIDALGRIIEFVDIDHPESPPRTRRKNT
jgi:hypothetical protein